MTWVINMISGPGSGKSTLAAELFVYMKKRGYKVEYLQEYAKILVWRKKYHILNDQHMVSYKYFRSIKAIYDCDDVDFVILDSSLLNGLYYNTLESNVSDMDKTASSILEYYNKFNNYNVFVERSNEYEYETAGRIQNEKESIAIDNKLRKTIKIILGVCDTIKISIQNNQAVINLFNMVIENCVGSDNNIYKN